MKQALDLLIESVPENTSRRFTCPSCRGANSLSITKVGSEVRYRCFRASCNLKPRVLSVKSSLNSLKTRLNGVFKSKEEFYMPDYWIMGIASEKCLKMLLNTHTLESYKKGRFNIAYDPREDRLVYLVKDKQGAIVGAIGRTLSGKIPKTLNYPNSADVPFKAGRGDVLVLVEDCPSACVIGGIDGYVGMALLGTNLKESYILHMLKYKTIYVALDYDARKKALAIKNCLKYYCSDVRMIILKQDIKDMEDVSEIIPH